MPIHRVPDAPSERVRIKHTNIPAASITVTHPFNPKPINPNSYYHSGNLGDLIYGLLAIKKAGGGDLIIGPEQNQTHPADKPISESAFELLSPLLKLQPYLKSFLFSRHYRGILAKDMNRFRNQWNDHRIRNETGINLLAWMQCFTLGVHDLFKQDEPWLEVEDPIKTNKILINRTPRYRNDLFNWQAILRHFGSRNLLFVGLPEEHKEFSNRFSSDIEYHPVRDYLELARMAAGSNGFIGNQSFPMSLALGVGQRVFQEVWPNSPDCLFQRSNVMGFTGGEFPSSAKIEDWSKSALNPNEFHVEQIDNSGSIDSDSPFISVVCYNRLDVTERFIGMLLRNTPSSRIIIADNASSDGTREYLQDLAVQHPNITVIGNKENLGYQVPHNAAVGMVLAAYPKPNIFCVLNNDLEIGPGWWQKIQKAFDADPNLAIVGSSVGVCSQIDSAFNGSPAKNGQAPDYVEGSLIAIRTDVMERLGLFDPNLQFMYGEDSDLSLRVREAGYDIATLDLNCRHLSSQSLRIVSPLTRQKIMRCKAENLAWLVDRWQVYLRRKDFNYQVLVNREGAMGDVLMATPAIEALKKKWPLSSIHVQTKCPDVFKNNPWVQSADRQVQGNWDYTYDLDSAYERVPMVHPVLAYAKAIGLDLDLSRARLSLFPTEEDKSVARWVSAPLVIVHPGPTNWIGRDWPQVRWAQVIDWLVENGLQVAVIGSPWRFQNATNIIDKGTIQSLYCLMQSAEMFLGVDSGPFHIAQAAGLKSVVLFGTIYSHLRIMPSCRVIPVQANEKIVPCVGEHHRLPPPSKFSTCNGDCMRAISVDMVTAACEQLLTQSDENIRNNIHP